jgi:hypothetical protein
MLLQVRFLAVLLVVSHHYKYDIMIFISIIILIILWISYYWIPKLITKSQLFWVTFIQIFLLTSIYTFGVLLNDISLKIMPIYIQLMLVAILVAIIVGLLNNKHYIRLGVKKKRRK